jgi:hypothetical protein
LATSLLAFRSRPTMSISCVKNKGVADTSQPPCSA